jgi:hypothetical protein
MPRKTNHESPVVAKVRWPEILGVSEQGFDFLLDGSKATVGNVTAASLLQLARSVHQLMHGLFGL